MPAQPKIPGAGRPPPPAEMSQREQQIWQSVVDSKPLNYFDAGVLPLLAALCTHQWQSELIAQEMRHHPMPRLRVEFRRETAMVATLASRLRLGKIGLRKHQSSEALEAASAPRRRLWEVMK